MPVKSKVKISQNFVVFSEYMNFKGKMKVNGSRRQIIGFHPIIFDLANYCHELMVRQSLRDLLPDTINNDLHRSIWALGTKTKESLDCFFSHYAHNDLTEKT